ncbi:MAG: hypothetical protein NTX92_01610 [Euryarchaeota archaeon]|nr:hypothetical protein [Euryarchaeota archaeon]
MKHLWVVCICLCCVLPLVQASIVTNQKNTQSPSDASVLDGGWVEERDNITILHVSGSHYQMGFQHGYLLQEEVQENVRAFLYSLLHLSWRSSILIMDVMGLQPGDLLPQMDNYIMPGVLIYPQPFKTR